MSKIATPECDPQGVLGYLGTFATLLPELVERILSFADHSTKLELNRTSKALHAVLLRRKTSSSDKEPCTRLHLDTAGNPVAASRALHMAAHAAYGVALVVQSKKPVAAAASSGQSAKNHAWLDTLLQPWLIDAGNSPAATVNTETGESSAAAAAAAHGTKVAAGNMAAAAAAVVVVKPPCLRQVKSITLNALQLDHPFPTCIGQAFPQLLHYKLDVVQWPSTALMGPVCWPHLQFLEICGYDVPQFPHALSSSNFPALTKLRLHGRFTSSEQRHVMDFCVAFSQQLTSLDFNFGSMLVPPENQYRLAHNAHFPCLTSARLHWKLTNVEFRDLLTACPSLRQVQMGFSRGSIRAVAAAWKSLALRTGTKALLPHYLTYRAHPRRRRFNWVTV